MTRRSKVVVVSLAVAFSGASCGGWQISDQRRNEPVSEGGAGGEANDDGGMGDDAGVTPCAVDMSGATPAPARMGLRIVQNEIQDADGVRVVLRGVNRSGSEYMCMRAAGFFDGPGADAAAEQSVRAIAAWKVNAVRVPLNESCWLGTGGAPEAFSGQAYKDVIRSYVALLQKYGIVPILDLHWAAPGDLPAIRLQPMPNADHTPDFWADVAQTFMDNSGVVFELYNEPYPDSNRDTTAAWSCWRDGCEVNRSGYVEGDGAPRAYAAAGMQSLVDAIRATGSSHVILLGGVQYSNALTGWLEYRPSDQLGQLAAAWHVYNFNGCREIGCFGGAPTDVAREVPVVATEIGQNDCEGEAFLSPLLEFLDSQNSGYLAWSWNAFGVCSPEVRPGTTGQPWSLVTSYTCPEPNSNYARTFFDHLRGGLP